MPIVNHIDVIRATLWRQDWHVYRSRKTPRASQPGRSSLGGAMVWYQLARRDGSADWIAKAMTTLDELLDRMLRGLAETETL